MISAHSIKRFFYSPTGIIFGIGLIIACIMGLSQLYSASKDISEIITQETAAAQTAVTFKTETPPANLDYKNQKKASEKSFIDNTLKSQVNAYLPPSLRQQKEPVLESTEPVLETLYTATDIEQIQKSVVAPFGRLIKCETVLTIDSSNIETPIIALVTEDLMYDGACIIPAGTEVHGTAQTTKNRNRIATHNEWTFVWVTQDASNGQQIIVKGIALDKDQDLVHDTWSMIDGAAGIQGTILKADDLAEMKLFGATFLGGVIAAIQEPSSIQVDNRNRVSVAKTSFQTAASQGISAVIERYAEGVMESIEKEGFFIRIPAGKQFYLYVQQSIDIDSIQKMK